MIRMFYCHGYNHLGKDERDFFLAVRIRDERLKHRDLTLQDIYRYAGERHPSIRIIRFQEDPALSMLAQKIYSELLGHQDDTIAMELIERLLDGAAAIAVGQADIYSLADCVT